ncbi:MAG TPA: hypothetical protein VGO25_10970 [Rhodanobacteraceae bacterium]|jgi:hypothetical protein|nr:hypothetical protein [Rhodanobacteraceae bacterium]
MDSQAFTFFHVAISLIAIVAGLIVLYGLLSANRMAATTFVFLVTTIATSATGFFFHRDHLLPSHIVGVISLIVLAVTTYALYGARLRGFWRPVYVVGAVISLYLNVFVLVVQSFLKIPALHALAPNGSEPPFALAQGIVLVLFIVLGVLAVKRFHPAMSGGTLLRRPA